MGVGAGVAIYVLRRVTKATEIYTPKGLATAITSLGDAVRDFAADVRAGMTEREDELLEALGVSSEGRPIPADTVQRSDGRHGR
jgi:hypothetical protein